MMCIIQFKRDIPEGFSPVMTCYAGDVDEVLDMVTRKYMKVNYPELVVGENDYEMKRASKIYHKECEYAADPYSGNDYYFDIITAENLN